jgi:hypothetical protein
VPFAKCIGGHTKSHGHAAEYHQGRDHSRAEGIRPAPGRNSDNVPPQASCTAVGKRYHVGLDRLPG